MNTEQRIERGARLLDVVYGPLWDERIKLDRLNLHNGCQCVLGQLHPRASLPYHKGLEKIGVSHLDAEQYGFSRGGYSRVSWSGLTRRWKRLIRSRRRARA